MLINIQLCDFSCISYILLKTVISLRVCVCWNDAIPSLFFHSYPLLHFTWATLKWRTNLRSTDLLIMQSESEVRLLWCNFPVRSCPCPPFSVVAVFPEPQSGVDKLWPGACLSCIVRCIWGFSGQGLQRSSFRVPWGFPDQNVFTQPRLHRATAPGWSRTVTKWLLWLLSQQDLSPRSRLLHYPAPL